MRGIQIKIKSNEHFRALQIRMFELGYFYKCSGSSIIEKRDSVYIVVREDGTLTARAWGFSGYDTITLDDLYDMKTTPTLKVDTLEYTIEVQDNYTVKVGCQQVSFEDARKIAEFLTENLPEQTQKSEQFNSDDIPF